MEYHQDADSKGHAIDHVEDSNSGIRTPPDYDDSIEATKPSQIVWLITLCVATGGFLFGYDTGYISAVLVLLGTDLGKELSSSEQELITSITSGGALIGALVAGLRADSYGRKFGIYAGCIFFVIGTVLQAAAFSLAQMTVGRFIVGLGVGSAAMIVPLYISEISPAAYRGRMIGLNNMAITSGQLISYAIGAGFTSVLHGWRYIVALGGVPPLVLLFLLPMCPESPRQLISLGKIDEATKIITRVYPHANEQQVKAKIDHMNWVIQTESAIEGKSVWYQFKRLNMVPSNLRAAISACFVMGVSQMGGFNTLMYYSSTLFALVGFDNSTAVSIVVGATNFVFTIANMMIVDRAGRRKILLVGLMGMSMSLVVAAVAFNWIPISADLELEATSVNWAGNLVLVTIVVYIAFYATGVGNTAWLGTEFFVLEVRALGTTMITVTCWGTNLILSSTFLTMMKSMTASGAFGFYAGVCFVGFVFVFLCYPEVAGLPLEEIKKVFEHDFGVKRARELRREQRNRQEVSAEGVKV